MNPLIKILINMVLHPQQTSKVFKIILTVCISIFLGIAVLIIGFLHLPFEKEGNELSVTEEIVQIYDTYRSEVRDQKVKEIATEYKEANPDAKIIVIRNNPTPSFLVAYLMMKHDPLNKYKPKEKEIYKYLESVVYYKEYDEGDAHYIETGFASFEEQLEKIRWKKRKEAFKLFYGVCKYNYGEDERLEQSYDEFMKSMRKSLSGEVPLYLQYDSKWGFLPVMGGNIASSGCSITSLAMVISYFHQQEILPSDVQEWAWAGGANPYYVAPYGASWAIFPAAASNWDLTITPLGTDINAVVSKLQEGEIVIASCNPGTFTRSGHFIVLTGVDENGQITVNDPNDNPSKNFHEKTFPPSLFARECAAYWSFWKEGFVVSSASSEEVDLVARIVALEAGYTNRNGMMGVAEVIRNRVESPQFPDTYTGVVSAPGQFTTYAYINTVTPTEEQLQIVSDVMSNKASVFNDPDVLYFCSQGYFNSSGKYGWWGNMQHVATYDNMFFKP